MYSDNYVVKSLPDDFYFEQPWVDRSVPHYGPDELEEYITGSKGNTSGEYLAPISNLLCPWPTTLYPVNEEWAKGLSLIYDGKEFVCRTTACRHELIFPEHRNTKLFTCEVCQNIQIPNATVFVYCYVFQNNAPTNVRRTWPSSFLRVCWTHFLIHGKDNGRRNELMVNSWSVSKKKGLRESLFKN